MKIYNKQLGITFTEAVMVVVLTTAFGFAGTVLMAGLGITTHFLIA